MTGLPRGPVHTIWIVAIVALLYVPIVSVVLASLANTRYMRFPHKVWTLDAYARGAGDRSRRGSCT